jgi:tetratricopeptide (TPR) repeat protein
MRTGSRVSLQFGIILLIGLWPDTLLGQQRDAPFLAGLRHYEVGEYDLAAEAFRESAESNPFHRDARFKLLSSLFGAERWTAAVPVAEDLLDLDPLNGIAFVYLTRCLAELGERERADEVFSEYRSIGYEVYDLRLEEVRGEGTKVTGMLKNLNRVPGAEVLLRFHFGGEQGQEIGAMGVSLDMPDEDDSVEFEEFFASSERAVGFRYEIVR